MVDSFTSNELEFIDIYEQYVDQASFLWLMHTIAVDQPHYSIHDLIKLEQRLDAQLSGLMTNLDLSWKICKQALEFEGGGELFVASIVAFRSRDQKNIQTVVEAANLSDECLKGLVYALAWLPGKLVHDWIRKFFTSKDINHKYLAVEACILRGEDPDNYLNAILDREDCQQHTGLYSSSLKSIAMFKRHDLAEYVNKAIDHKDPDVKFWAIWSVILLGEKAQAINLEPYIFKTNKFQKEAIQLSLRVLSIADSRQWVNKVASDPEQTRLVITMVGVIGDPQAIEWLIKKMNELNFARIAAESFSMITGADLEQMGMILPAPQNYEPLPNDDADDENVSMHDDENLPWPDAAKIYANWNTVKASYTFGQRYLLGRPIELETLKVNLHSAYQRQRHAAAYEIALLARNEPLVNTRRVISIG